MNKKMIGMSAVLVAVSKLAFAGDPPMEHTMHLQMQTSATVPAPASAPANDVGKPFKTYIANPALIRKAPRQNSVEYQAIGKNEAVIVLGIRGRWLFVELPISITGKPQKGYIYGQSFTKEAIETAEARFGAVKAPAVARPQVKAVLVVKPQERVVPEAAPVAESAPELVIGMAVTKEFAEIQSLKQKLAVAEQQLATAEGRVLLENPEIMIAAATAGWERVNFRGFGVVTMKQGGAGRVIIKVPANKVPDAVTLMSTALRTLFKCGGDRVCLSLDSSLLTPPK